jgi:hypothetical protein
MHTLLLQLVIFTYGMDHLGLTLGILLALKDQQAQQVLLVLKVLMVLLEVMEQLVQQVHKDYREVQAPQGPQVRSRVQLDLQVHKVFKVFKGHLDQRVQQALRLK